MVSTIEAARRRRTLIALAFVAFVIVTTGVATLIRFGDIESDLETRSQTALREQGIVVEVEFRGRDATLRGAVATEQDRAAAIEIVGGVHGVRSVHDELTVIADPTSGEPEAAPAHSGPVAVGPIPALRGGRP
jgi:hypothetical protein